MNRAVFLDRDGTINVDKGYVYRKEDFIMLPGVIEALALLQDAGFLLIIITNQSGIARGYYTEEQYKELEAWIEAELKEKGITITKTYYCPHLPDAKVEKYRIRCTCRKPGLDLYFQAATEFDIDLDYSYTIGDKLRDCEIRKRTKCKAYLVGNHMETGGFSILHDVVRHETLLECAKEIVEVEQRRNECIRNW